VSLFFCLWSGIEKTLSAIILLQKPQPQIENINMPKVSLEAVKWLLQHTPSPAIVEIVRGSGQTLASILKGGFKLDSKSFENASLRLRLSTLLSKEKEMFEAFLLDVHLMRSWSRPCAAMEIIDPDWLKENWRQFLRTVADPRPLVLGIYWVGKAAEDEKLERLCHWLFACPSLWGEPTLAKQDAELLGALGYLTGNKTKESTQVDSGKLAALRQKLEQDKVAAQKALDHSRKESKQQQRVHEAELQQWRQKCAAADRELKEREEHWQKQYKQLESSAKEFSRAEIAVFEQRLLGLQPEFEAQMASIRSSNHSLSERIEKTLQLQAANNRHFGLRQELRQEIAGLERRLLDIQQAIEESLVVHASLPELQTELETRIFQLKEQLAEDGFSRLESDIPQRMRNMIKTVRFDDQAPQVFSEIKHFLEHEYVRQLMRPEELRSAHTMLDEQRKKHSHIVSAKDSQASGHTHLGEVWFVEQHIQDFHRISLYIDGCNLILCDPQWKELTMREGQAYARGEVIAKCKSKAALFKGVNLIFDGIEAQDSIERINDHLSVHFAGRKESEQNADNYLVALLKDTPREAKELRWVITKDIGLQVRVAHLCDAIVPNQSLAKFLRAN
jgi:predicted RNA-binding protein with PIN domain